MADQYEEWFHRETQEVLSVKVGDAEAGFPNEIVFTLCSHCNQWYEVFREDLQRDYIRDEPLTLKLLGRLGWEVNYDAGVAQSGPAYYFSGEDNCRFVAIRNSGEITFEVRVGHRSDEYETEIPVPRTLRDLLNVLRVFGVESSVPPAPAENPSS